MENIKQPILRGHEGIQDGVAMIDTAINNIRDLLLRVKNGSDALTCLDKPTNECYMSLADALEQVPGALAEQSNTINLLIKELAVLLSLRV